MKVLLDVLGSPRRSGGMRLHGEEIVRTWRELYPRDDLVVMGHQWIRESFSDLDVSLVTWPTESVFSRFTGQVLLQPVVALLKNADAVISLSPIVSPLNLSRPSFCFEHDWRHLKNKEEFGLAQKTYRRLWELSAWRATACLCISEKAQEETLQLVKGARTEIVPNGGDHPRRWDVARPDRDGVTSIVTFGHQNNKRPDLVIRALQHADENVTLTVLGARGQLAQELRNLAQSIGNEDRVVLPGFVEEQEYQNLIANADCVVLASSDEGFGLPIAEALYFGIPVVVAEDSGVADMHGPEVISAPPTPEGMGAAIDQALVRGRGPAGDVPSWKDTVQILRGKVASSL